jgi:hypothetical protein
MKKSFKIEYKITSQNNFDFIPTLYFTMSYPSFNEVFGEMVENYNNLLFGYPDLIIKEFECKIK